MTTPNEKLLSCPFCGSEAAWHEVGKGGSWHPIIHCSSALCYAKVAGTGSLRDEMRRDAAKIWNKRIQPAASEADQPKCHKCGLPMMRNPHPDAGQTSRMLEVGCPLECLPCTVLSRHQWSQRAYKAEKELREASEAGAVPVEPSALEASIRDLDAWEVRSDGNELTPAESEAIMLVLHELKRLRAAPPSAPAADPVGGAGPAHAAFETLKACIQADPAYAWTWHCSIWAGAHDEGLLTDAANRAAARFMHMAFGVDTSKHENFAAMQSAHAAESTEPPFKLLVGDSRFEGWFSEYNPAKKGTKQQMREAYEAGLNDSLRISPTAATADAAERAEPADIERMAINRYRPVPGSSFLSYNVVAGDGKRALYSGTKDSCNLVARRLTEAFLDGAFVAAQSTAATADAQPVCDSVQVAQGDERAAQDATDSMCAWRVWWNHNKARFTTTRQSSLAAWDEATARAALSRQPSAPASDDEIPSFDRGNGNKARRRAAALAAAKPEGGSHG